MHRGNVKAMRRAFLGICLAAIVAACGSACAPSVPSAQGDSGAAQEVFGELATLEEEEGARECVSGLLSLITEKDAKAIRDLLSPADFTPKDFGVSWKAFSKAYFSKFSYEIVGIEEGKNDDDAVGVDVTILASSMPPVIDVMSAANHNALDAGANPQKAGYANKAFLKQYSKTDIKQEKLSAVVYVSRDSDGLWQVCDKGLFAAFLMGGYDPRQL